MVNTLILAGLVLSIVQIIKTAFKISSRYIPLISFGVMVLVVLFAWVYSGYPKIPLEALLSNVVAVLTAMGLWSGVKSTIGK